MSNEPFQLEQEQVAKQEEWAGVEKLRALQMFAGNEMSNQKALQVWRVLNSRQRDATERAFRTFSIVRNAIDHALLQIKMNQSVSYMLGVGTETYEQLTGAKAALLGMPVDEIRDEIFPGSAAVHRKNR